MFPKHLPRVYYKLCKFPDINRVDRLLTRGHDSREGFEIEARN